MAEMNAGNLYDVNKELVKKNDKPLKGKALLNKVNEVVTPYIDENIKNDCNYMMLLCNELRDYTVFNFSVLPDMIPIKINNFNNSFKSCLLNRGIIYSIEKTEDNIALEIWLLCDSDGEMHCYYLFPYDAAVIEL